jgi:hypothetical protein
VSGRFDIGSGLREEELDELLDAKLLPNLRNNRY